MTQQKLIITKDTFLKAFPLQSAGIKKQKVSHGLIKVKKGCQLDIVGQIAYDGAAGADDDHIYVQLKRRPQRSIDELRWFVYGDHACLEGNEPGNDPKQDEPLETPSKAKKLDFGPTINIPGISKPVGIYQPIYSHPTVSNFTWAELTKGGARIPVDAIVTQRIVRMARKLDEIRAFLGGHPIRITSGYRDPISNRYVGGARDSRHMYGDAVDFWVEGMNVVDVFYKLKGFHPKGGLAVGNGFVHIDLRPGAAARWTYPGGPCVDLW